MKSSHTRAVSSNCKVHSYCSPHMLARSLWLSLSSCLSSPLFSPSTTHSLSVFFFPVFRSLSQNCSLASVTNHFPPPPPPSQTVTPLPVPCQPHEYLNISNLDPITHRLSHCIERVEGWG